MTYTYLQIIVCNLFFINVSNLKSSIRRLKLDLLHNLATLNIVTTTNSQCLLWLILSPLLISTSLSLSWLSTFSYLSWSVWSIWSCTFLSPVLHFKSLHEFSKFAFCKIHKIEDFVKIYYLGLQNDEFGSHKFKKYIEPPTFSEKHKNMCAKLHHPDFLTKK